MSPVTKKPATLVVQPIRRQTLEVAVLGTTPLILHRMAEKGLHELLFPGGRKTTAARAETLKHEPIEEFRAAAETLPDGPTLLALMSTAFKAAMMTAALDLPGSTKAQIGRLVYVHGEKVPIYGTPRILLSVTRSSDAGRTPDVRSRPILPRWAATLRISYQVPLLTERSIVNLLAGAGQICGVGDWRQEKGKGSYGQYVLTSPNDAEWLSIMGEGRGAQVAAMESPEPYDAQTSELLNWFEDERERRGRNEEEAVA